MKKAPKTIDEYIAGYPANVQTLMQKIRATIRKAAPAAEETISYGIPAFRLNGSALVYFAGYKEHIGLYPIPSDVEELEDALAPYASGKATVRFPIDAPLPYGLITKIVKYLAKRNTGKAATKAKKKR